MASTAILVATYGGIVTLVLNNKNLYKDNFTIYCKPTRWVVAWLSEGSKERYSRYLAEQAHAFESRTTQYFFLLDCLVERNFSL